MRNTQSAVGGKLARLSLPCLRTLLRWGMTMMTSNEDDDDSNDENSIIIIVTLSRVVIVTLPHCAGQPQDGVHNLRRSQVFFGIKIHQIYITISITPAVAIFMILLSRYTYDITITKTATFQAK